MNILILNQAFYPDVVSVAQHANDLAVALIERGHNVTVIASRRAYDSPQHTFPPREEWQAIDILRVPSTALGKKRLWRRVCDFSSFYFACVLRLTTLPRYDLVIAMTVPPLISVIGAVFTRIRGGKLLSWVMDLNPDEAIAAGVLQKDSVVARVLSALLRFSLASSSSVVVLDRFMRDLIAAKGVPQEKISVIPPWSHDSVISYDVQGRNQFRASHGLSGKFVVMYSGNHSPCHPLDTLLAAAEQLANEPHLVFLFVGGGSQLPSVREFARKKALENIICLPYQPLTLLSSSLSAADLHVVVMGEGFVGTVHPCKIYNILAIASPFLYIGPSPNHITELSALMQSESAYFASHGDTDSVVSQIRDAVARGPRREVAHAELGKQFSDRVLISRLISVIEDCNCAPVTLGTAPLANDAPEERCQ